MSGCDQSATTTDCSTLISQNPPPPASSATAEQVIVIVANPSTPAPAGYQSFKDVRQNVTFNAPDDWKPQVLPEGDGQPSMISADFSDPLGTMKGAYIHYSIVTELPDSFKGNPDGYMALLKQGMTWSDTRLDGHPAYITKTSDGYAMVVSPFGDNWFVTVNFVDRTRKYSSVLDEFMRSFHTQFK